MSVRLSTTSVTVHICFVAVFSILELVNVINYTGSFLRALLTELLSHQEQHTSLLPLLRLDTTYGLGGSNLLIVYMLFVVREDGIAPPTTALSEQKLLN